MKGLILWGLSLLLSLIGYIIFDSITILQYPFALCWGMIIVVTIRVIDIMTDI